MSTPDTMDLDDPADRFWAIDYYGVQNVEEYARLHVYGNHLFPDRIVAQNHKKNCTIVLVDDGTGNYRKVVSQSSGIRPNFPILL